MHAKCYGLESLSSDIHSIYPGFLLRPGIARRVTVLLLALMVCPLVSAHDPNVSDLRFYEFTCQFQLPMGSGRLEGLMASDGCRHRIAIYWIEPSLFREAKVFVRYSDFIFDGEAIHYWVFGMPEAGVFHSSERGRFSIGGPEVGGVNRSVCLGDC